MSPLLKAASLVLNAAAVVAASLAYALYSYQQSLVRGENAWWLRGGLGRRLGSSLLAALFNVTKAAGVRRHNELMAKSASAKAAMLANADKGGICFVGSSTFTYWPKLAEDMRSCGVEASCLNAGFGGACSQQVLDHMDALCVACAPAVVVYFCGTNDLNLGLRAAPAENFATFVARLRQALPDARVVYLAATVTPFVELVRGDEMVRRFQADNRAARAVAEHYPGGSVEYVDSAAFQRDAEWYLGDMHHLNTDGHRRLAELLAPAIQRGLRR